MKPHNSEDRNKAFRNFLLFFILTVCIIAAAIFFSVQVPFKENEKLKAEMAEVARQKLSADMFADKMDVTIRLLDSVNLAGVQAELIDGDIDENLKNMKAMVRNDSALEIKSLFTNVVDNLNELKNAKKQLRDASGKDASLGDLQKENAELRNNLQQLNTNYQQCLMMNTYLQKK